MITYKSDLNPAIAVLLRGSEYGDDFAGIGRFIGR